MCCSTVFRSAYVLMRILLILNFVLYITCPFSLAAIKILRLSLVFPGGSVPKESTCSAGDLGLIPGSDPWVRKLPGEGNGNALQYPCLGNLMDRGAWRATARGVTKNQTRLSSYTTSTILGFSVLTRMCLHVFSRFFLLEIC